MRQKIVAGNWKMNTTLDEGLVLVNEVINNLKEKPTTSVLKIIAPPYIHLSAIALKTNTIKDVAVAAQNCHHESQGAFTGEISAKMIASTGATYVIIGHSERRLYFGETNQLLAKKVNRALKENLTPIFCIGENLTERNTDNHFNVIDKQLQETLFHLSATNFKKIIIAYEPVWAIGTGHTATSEQAQEMHFFIRKEINKKYGEEISSNISILYGGSCTSKNAKELFACADVDGGLIGGASLNATDFMEIVRAF